MFRRRVLVGVIAAATNAVALPTLAWNGSVPSDRVLAAGRVINVDIDAGKIAI